MYCKKCGCDLDPTVQYCSFCGSKNEFAERTVHDSGFSGILSSATRKVKAAASDGSTKIDSQAGNDEIEKRQELMSIVTSAVLIILSFLDWVVFLGGYGGKYSILKLMSTPVSDFYWLDDGVLLFQLFTVVISISGWLMVILNTVNIVLQITKNKNKKKVEKMAALVSDYTCLAFLIVMLVTKMILMVGDGGDLSGAFRIKWPAFVAVFLSMMFLGLSSADIPNNKSTGLKTN